MAGRPTKYNEKFADLAYSFCLLGADDAFLALEFGVDEATINRWKIKYPEFCESLKKGKAIADAKIVQSLYKRAKGFDFTERHYELKKVKTAEGEAEKEEMVCVKKVVKYIAPDPVSIIYWLNNRQPKYWKNKQPDLKPDTPDKPKPPWLTSDNLDDDGPDE